MEANLEANSNTFVVKAKEKTVKEKVVKEKVVKEKTKRTAPSKKKLTDLSVVIQVPEKAIENKEDTKEEIKEETKELRKEVIVAFDPGFVKMGLAVILHSDGSLVET
jgi:hypothetical protein